MVDVAKNGSQMLADEADDTDIIAGLLMKKRSLMFADWADNTDFVAWYYFFDIHNPALYLHLSSQDFCGP